MTIQKFIKYTPLDITGKSLDSTQELTLNILEKSGNYLLHKDLLRHSSLKRQGTVSTKTRSEVRGGGRKTMATKRNRACSGWVESFSLMERWGGLFLVPSQKLSLLN